MILNLQRCPLKLIVVECSSIFYKATRSKIFNISDRTRASQEPALQPLNLLPHRYASHERAVVGPLRNSLGDATHNLTKEILAKQFECRACNFVDLPSSAAYDCGPRRCIVPLALLGPLGERRLALRAVPRATRKGLSLGALDVTS